MILCDNLTLIFLYGIADDIDIVLIDAAPDMNFGAMDNIYVTKSHIFKSFKFLPADSTTRSM